MAESFEQLQSRINKSVVSGVAHFNKLIKEYAEKAPKAIVLKLQRVMILEAIKRLIQKTPVDTGHARGSWQTEQGSGTAFDISRPDKSGGNAQQEAGLVAARLDDFALVTIFNNAPYIVVLESGSSKQAPRGMLRLTIKELEQAFP